MSWAQYTKCNGCPNRYQCNDAGECLDMRRQRAVESNRRLIAEGLDAYDARRVEILAARAVDPKFEQPKPAPVVCWHILSDFNICTKCGYWKKS